MKEANTRSLVEMDPHQLQQLCEEVKETLAECNQKETRQSFGPADLWQIRKFTRYRVQRRANL